MNKKQYTLVKESEFDKPLIRKAKSKIDSCFREFPNKFYHSFDYICVYDVKLSSIRNNEKIILTVSDKSTAKCESNENLEISRKN